MWHEITVFTQDDAQLNALSDAFEEAGALAITITDAGDNPIFEPDIGTTPFWPENKMTVLFDIGDEIDAIMQQVHQTCLFAFEYTHQTLADDDWQSRFKQQFSPTCFANRLWIYPSWDIPTLADDQASVMLDPGMAFGTGTHPTTRMCLQALAELPLAGKTVVDYGCGSGILAIAAIKLGAKKAIAIDIDPQALEATRYNAERNGVDETQLLTAFPDDERINTPADVVVANILANPLISLADTILNTVSPGGRVILSGILAEQAPAVEACYSAHCGDITQNHEAEWVSIRCAKQ